MKKNAAVLVLFLALASLVAPSQAGALPQAASLAGFSAKERSLQKEIRTHFSEARDFLRTLEEDSLETEKKIARITALVKEKKALTPLKEKVCQANKGIKESRQILAEAAKIKDEDLAAFFDSHDVSTRLLESARRLYEAKEIFKEKFMQ